MKFPYIYPDPETRRLRAALAEDSGLESEYILAGCGADELIDLIMRLGSEDVLLYKLSIIYLLCFYKLIWRTQSYGNFIFFFYWSRCVLEPGDKIVDCPPTFTMYEFDAAVNAASVIKGEKDFLYVALPDNLVI